MREKAQKILKSLGLGPVKILGIKYDIVVAHYEPANNILIGDMHESSSDDLFEQLLVIGREDLANFAEFLMRCDETCG